MELEGLRKINNIEGINKIIMKYVEDLYLKQKVIRLNNELIFYFHNRFNCKYFLLENDLLGFYRTIRTGLNINNVYYIVDFL